MEAPKGVDERNDSPSPHHIAEMPCGKGFRHGESLPKGLPKGLPIQGGFGRMADALRITKAYTWITGDGATDPYDQRAPIVSTVLKRAFVNL